MDGARGGWRRRSARTSEPGSRANGTVSDPAFQANGVASEHGVLAGVRGAADSGTLPGAAEFVEQDARSLASSETFFLRSLFPLALGHSFRRFYSATLLSVIFFESTRTAPAAIADVTGDRREQLHVDGTSLADWQNTNRT